MEPAVGLEPMTDVGSGPPSGRTTSIGLERLRPVVENASGCRISG
jgi:hypothetical protein